MNSIYKKEYFWCSNIFVKAGRSKEILAKSPKNIGLSISCANIGVRGMFSSSRNQEIDWMKTWQTIIEFRDCKDNYWQIWKWAMRYSWKSIPMIKWWIFTTKSSTSKLWLLSYSINEARQRRWRWCPIRRHSTRSQLCGFKNTAWALYLVPNTRSCKIDSIQEWTRAIKLKPCTRLEKIIKSSRLFGSTSSSRKLSRCFGSSGGIVRRKLSTSINTKW